MKDLAVILPTSENSFTLGKGQACHMSPCDTATLVTFVHF